MNVNLSLNGIPGTIWEIRRQEYIHWYLGYRQAILIINSLNKALKEAEVSQKKAVVEINKKKRQQVLEEDPDTVEILNLEIEIAQDSFAEQSQMIIDGQVELSVALVEKERIESEYPEILSKSYIELQQEYAEEAFQNKLVRATAISAYSSGRNLSEGVSEIMYDMQAFSAATQEKFLKKLATATYKLMTPHPQTVTSPQIVLNNLDQVLLSTR